MNRLMVPVLVIWLCVAAGIASADAASRQGSVVVPSAVEGWTWDGQEAHYDGRAVFDSALTPQFYGRGANFFDRRYVWPYKALIVGTDPVAVDTVGARLLQAKRIAFFGEDRALDVTPHHIQVADTEYRLGVSDLRRIEVVKLGWMEDVLI